VVVNFSNVEFYKSKNIKLFFALFTKLLNLISIYVIFIEICAVSKVSKKEIGRCFKLTLRALETSVDLITSGDFMVNLVIVGLTAYCEQYMH
jgi:hypothetical protein